jgi:hypothetical protein
MGQRPTAHIGERGDLDHAFFGQTRDVLGIEHVVERIIQRAQVGENFLAQVAGQETEGFTGLDGGSGQDHALDLVLEQRVHCRGHGEVGFAGAGGPDAEHHRVIQHRLQVELLAERLRDDRLPVRGDDERLIEKRLQLFAFAPDKRIGDPMKVRRAKDHALRASFVEKTEK